MPIKRYANNVFTNDGQSTVAEFEGKLAKAAGAIRPIRNLTVYVGYHGDAAGNHFADFDAGEMTQVRAMKIVYQFRDATLNNVSGGMADAAIIAAVGAGNVFFTWCDSDTKVNALMGGGMPALIATYN